MRVLLVVLVWLVLFVVGCGPVKSLTPEQAPSTVPIQRVTGVSFPSEKTVTLTTEIVTTISTSSPTSVINPILTPPVSETETLRPTHTPEATTGESQLKMVLIRAKSPDEVQKLRQMNLDIVRITPIESRQTPASKKDFLKHEFIIEAVLTPGLQAKLDALGFEISELP